MSFVQLEQEVLRYWEEIDAFELSKRLSANAPEYVFYDGPPFATGTPHYGHILAGTIKDVVCRYWYMNGRNVERRFGWDTHGLPIEFEINKLYNIKTTQEVLDIGIAEYNRRCREVVMRCAEDWRRTVTRLGRWIDFDNDYRTMYPSYMESLWWVFSRLWEKNLVYRGEKVIAYSTECATPLSNFEANLAYRSRSDPELYVLFNAVDEPDLTFVAWTTTPWTLPSNLALCVHPDFVYAVVLDKSSGKRFVVLQSRIRDVFTPRDADAELEVLTTVLGSELVEKIYRPLFPYFVPAYGQRAFRVLADRYVRDDVGSGIVHQAPAFGEDDHRICLANGVIASDLPLPCPLDPNAHFTVEVPDFQGMQVFEANPAIIQHLKAAGNVLRSGSIVHMYPHCWRSATPLIYRAIPCWFIRAESMREDMLRNNRETRWVPRSVNRRFENWLTNTADWAVSRNRFWGTPLPIWTNSDFSDVVVVRSVDHLEALSGVRPSDLHRESIDHIIVRSPTTGQPLRRVDEVFDCWFESGAMPYAQCHYPFENEEKFGEMFPADFIGEGLDQTRGWFYTLLILSTALFDRPASKNVIVNGIVLASDGRKMSKSLKNYPDPELMIEKYGADAMRLYLINSPLLRAQEIKFREEGLNEVVQEIFTPWYNAYVFFSLACDQYMAAHNQAFVADLNKAKESSNTTDRWILAALQSLVKLVRTEMESYHLYRVTPHLVDFINSLTNGYVRFNRSRLKGYTGISADQLAALNTLFEVLLSLCKLMAPLTPFITETLYQKLRRFLPSGVAASSASSLPPLERSLSVHFQSMPVPQDQLTDNHIVKVMKVFQQILVTGRRIRDRNAKPIKTPLAELVVLVDDPAIAHSLEAEVQDYLRTELNVVKVDIKSDLSMARRFVTANSQSMGKKIASYMNALRLEWQQTMNPKQVKAKMAETHQLIWQAVASLTCDDVKEFERTGHHILQPFGIQLTIADVVFSSSYVPPTEDIPRDWRAETASAGLLIALDLQLNKDLEEESVIRELMSKVQLLRKAAKVKALDQVVAYLDTETSSSVSSIFGSNSAEISRRLRYPFLPLSEKPGAVELIIEKTETINREKVSISLAYHGPLESVSISSSASSSSSSLSSC